MFLLLFACFGLVLVVVIFLLLDVCVSFSFGVYCFFSVLGLSLVFSFVFDAVFDCLVLRLRCLYCFRVCFRVYLLLLF